MASAFGEFLHTVRTRTNGTKLAKATGISYVYLLDIEKGARTVPSDTVLLSLANNLPFLLGERERFFDLAAEEKKGIPIDISIFIRNNCELIQIVRKIKNASLDDEFWCSVSQSIEERIGDKFNET